MKIINTAITALLVIASGQASAATVNFQASPSTTYTNSIDYDGFTAFGITANSSNNFYNSSIRNWQGYGLGVQNGSSDNSHQVDNSGYKDFVLFQFDNNVRVNSVTVDSYGTNDIDASWWYGNISDLPATLNGSDFTNGNYSGTTSNPYTYDLGSMVIGNVLLFGTRWDQSNDLFKIAAIDFELAAVPLPAAVYLFGTGALALYGFSRRRKATKTVSA